MINNYLLDNKTKKIAFKLFHKLKGYNRIAQLTTRTETPYQATETYVNQHSNFEYTVQLFLEQLTYLRVSSHILN